VPRTRIVAAVLVLIVGCTAVTAQRRKQLIAHRGASGYAPEHTLASYRLAIEQGADFVEPDLGVTKDHVLICLHDDTLERTTNVAAVFPTRTSAVTLQARGPHWLAADFTIDEIRQLDAGRWFDERFAGQRIPTFQEMIDAVRGKAGIYPELKSPALYESRGVDQVQLVVEVIKKNGLDAPESLRTTPVVIQSFDETAIRRAARDLPAIPRVFLTSKDVDVTEPRLRELSRFVTGIAPEKVLIARHPDMVRTAHALGLTVTAWTFRADEKTRFSAVREEMSHFLYDLGIDALFTNNPDQFPRR
jgi:glycerophosphoryl diester phosphodiesterase